MPASIVQVGSSQRLRLSACDYVRKLTFGNDWSKIRISFLYGIDSGGSFSNKVAIGLCNGTADTYQSSNCTDFVGLEIPTRTWTIGGAGGIYYNQAYTAIGDAIRKVGNTITRIAGGGSSTVWWNANVNVATVKMVDIERVWPYYNITYHYDSGAPSYSDWSRYTLAINAGNEEYTYYSTYSRNGLDAGPVYDTLNIHWDAAFPCLNIKEIMVLRFH